MSGHRKLDEIELYTRAADGVGVAVDAGDVMVSGRAPLIASHWLKSPIQPNGTWAHGQFTLVIRSHIGTPL